MSQVFGGDSVSVTTSATLPQSGETTAVTGNFLNPPFQNAKAMVSATVQLTVPASATGITLRIRRNPNAENVIVQGSGTLNATATNIVLLSIQGSDPIPDGRPVQYAVTVAPTGASANGNIGNATISTLLISG